MKKTFIIISFVFIICSILFSKTAVSYDKIALDDKKNSTINIIKKEYKDKYTVDEYGGYKIQLDKNTTVFIYFEGETVSYISVEHKNYTYTEYLDLLVKIMKKHGEPKGSYADNEIYNIYWWAEPPHDVRLSITLGKPYTVFEQVFYGK